MRKEHFEFSTTFVQGKVKSRDYLVDPGQIPVTVGIDRGRNGVRRSLTRSRPLSTPLIKVT